MTCPKCGSEGPFDEGGPSRLWVCLECGGYVQLPVQTNQEKKKARSTAKKDSLKAEKRIATKLGHRHHSDSGAAWFQKGDMSHRTSPKSADPSSRYAGFSFIGSEKSTSKKSFSLKLEDLHEMVSWSRGGDIPYMVVSFSGEDFVLLPIDDFARILDAIEHNRGPGK